LKDEDLEAFVDALERHLSARRGRPHVLSPPDFALAREWHAARLPLAAVLAGIDRAFEAEADVSSLGFCRRHVEALARGAAPAAAERARAEEAQTPPEDLLARLLALRAAIAGVSSPALFERPLRGLAELLDLASVAREPNWSYLRGKLEDLDAQVEAAAAEALPAAEAQGLAAEAERAAQRQQGRVSESALEEARRRYLRRRARERFRLPRVGGG
jgi:hypothetical protein